MAAQSLVRPSFADPRTTYETNVMGTVNVLEAVRATPSVRVVVNVTSDKCYDNDATRAHRAFTEDDPIGGHDPYSSSKGCAELVADAYRRSFFDASARWSAIGIRPRRQRHRRRRLGPGPPRLPDVMRGALDGVPIPIRNPEAVRPWQHVLNPLSGYLRLAQRLHDSAGYEGGWNFGPAPDDARTVGWIADRITAAWPAELRWERDPGPHPHEAPYLMLDSTKAHERLGWAPTWELDGALARIVRWYRALHDGDDMRAVTLGQITAFAKATAVA